MRHSTKRAHQRCQRRGVVVDAAQQHRLADHRDAGIDEPGAAPRARRRQLARMVGVQRDIGRLAGRLAARATSAASTARARPTGTRVWKRTTFTCAIAASAPMIVAEPARRQDQRIAAGEDDLPDLRMRRDVGERRVELLARQRLPAPGRPSRAGSRSGNRPRRRARLQQHAVGIAMDDARRPGVCASSPIGSARSSGVRVQLGDVGHELARDRIVRIGRDRSASAIAGVIATA